MIDILDNVVELPDSVVTLPADGVSVKLPKSLKEKFVYIMFRDLETVECAIAQLESLRETMQ